jgi:hypothetical protein
MPHDPANSPAIGVKHLVVVSWIHASRAILVVGRPTKAGRTQHASAGLGGREVAGGDFVLEGGEG